MKSIHFGFHQNEWLGTDKHSIDPNILPSSFEFIPIYMCMLYAVVPDFNQFNKFQQKDYNHAPK